MLTFNEDQETEFMKSVCRATAKLQELFYTSWRCWASLNGLFLLLKSVNLALAQCVETIPSSCIAHFLVAFASLLTSSPAIYTQDFLCFGCRQVSVSRHRRYYTRTRVHPAPWTECVASLCLGGVSLLHLVARQPSRQNLAIQTAFLETPNLGGWTLLSPSLCRRCVFRTKIPLPFVG